MRSGLTRLRGLTTIAIRAWLPFHRVRFSDGGGWTFQREWSNRGGPARPRGLRLHWAARQGRPRRFRDHPRSRRARPARRHRPRRHLREGGSGRPLPGGRLLHSLRRRPGRLPRAGGWVGYDRGALHRRHGGTRGHRPLSRRAPGPRPLQAAGNRHSGRRLPGYDQGEPLRVTGLRLRGQAQRHPLALLVAAALVLRLATLTWGIGLGRFSGWYHPDESKAWSSVVGFPGNYLTNRNFLYGTALQYTLGTLLLPFQYLWHHGHPLVPSLTYLQFAVLAVRAVHAVLGALTVALIYRLALRLWDRPTALLAAALLAVSFYHTLDSAFATLDVPMGFLVTLGLLLAARAADAPGPREFAALGLVVGFLAGTKITGAALVVVPVAMARGAPQAERGRWVGGTAIAAAVPVTVFALSTPHVVLHPREYLEFMAR